MLSTGKTAAATAVEGVESPGPLGMLVNVPAKNVVVEIDVPDGGERRSEIDRVEGGAFNPLLKQPGSRDWIEFQRVRYGDHSSAGNVHGGVRVFRWGAGDLIGEDRRRSGCRHIGGYRVRPICSGLCLLLSAMDGAVGRIRS